MIVQTSVGNLEPDGVARNEIQRLVRFISAFEDRSQKEVLADVGMEIGENPVQNLRRNALSPKFKSEVVRRFRRLSPIVQTAIETKVSPRTLGNLGDSSLSGWMDLAHFDMVGFKDFPGWPNPRYLILRLSDAETLRISEMRIDYDSGKNPLPTFTTLRRTDSGDMKSVQGIALKAGSEVYTIGQLQNDDGLRFARLKVLKTQQGDNKPRTDLYGLRMGRRAGLAFSHVVYARQLTPDHSSAKVNDWMARVGSLVSVSDPGLKEFVPEIDRLLKFLHGDKLINGLQPKYWD